MLKTAMMKNASYSNEVIAAIAILYSKRIETYKMIPIDAMITA